MQTAFEEPAHVADNSLAREIAWRSRPVRLIIICGILLIGAIIAATAGLLSNLYNRELVENDRRLESLALVLAEQIDRSFQSIELIQTDLIERMQSLGIASAEDFERQMSGYDTHRRLKDKISALPHISAVVLTNPQGKLINFSRSWPIPSLRVPDQDPSEVFKSDPQLAFFVGKPLRGPAIENWVVPIARKFTGPNGEFLGVVLGIVELQYFENVFKSIMPGEGSSISLFRNDGTLLVRYPRIEPIIGQAFRGAIDVVGERERGTIRLVGKMDGKDRLLAVQRLAHFPLFIAVGNDVSVVLANWKRGAIYMTGAALMIGLVIGGIVVFTVWRVGKKLREQNLQRDTALSNMSQGLVMFDSAARLVICNDSYRKLFNLTPDFAKAGRTVLDILRYRAGNETFSGNPEQYVRDLRTTVAQGKPFCQIVETGDGRIISVVNLPMAGGGWVATHEDVTDKAQAETLIKNQKQQLNATLENVSQGVCMFDAAQRLVFCNKRYAELYGLNDEQTMPGTELRAILEHQIAVGNAPDDHENYINDRINEVSANKPYQITSKLSDGRYVSVVHRPMADGGWVATHEDITERKQAEALIEESHKNLKHAESMALLGHYKFEQGAPAVTWSEGLYRIVGQSPESFTPTLSSVLELVHSDDRPLLQQYRNDAMAGLDLPPVTLRLVKDDGQFIYVENWARPLRASDGSVTGMFGTLQDVTERKHIDEALALANQELIEKQYAIDQAVIVGITDVTGRITYVNDNFCQISGYAREELLGENHRILNSGSHSKAFFCDMYQLIASGQVWRGEVCNKAKGGSLYWLDTTIVPQLGPDGTPVGYMAIRVDITDRKRAEEELHRTQKFLDTVIEHVPVPIIVKDVAGLGTDVRGSRFTLFNRAYEELTGESRIQLIGKAAHQLFPKERADLIVRSDNETLRSDQVVVTSEHPIHTRHNGTRLVVAKKTVIRDENDKPQYLLTVVDDVTERMKSEQHIMRMAHYDTLTDLPNRVTFKDTMDATIERTATSGEEFAVLSIDLDRFKEANDTYGHIVGDALLREVARRLQAAAREVFLARLGGDEFALIVACGAQPAAAAALAERLLAVYADDFEVEGHCLKLGMSIGVAIYLTDGADAKTLMINADAALYRAKAESRGAALFFEPEMSARLHERYALQEDLRLAIGRGELLLHYQPQMKMSGETVGFEALARWQCPKRGIVPPGTFIPIAEESSLIISLGEWVLREACREAASWPQPLTIAVNISPIQFRHGELPRLVHSILLETGLAPGRLELEITEDVMINDFSRAVSILNQLKSLGVRITMDDFGTGYSSLSYLQSFRYDKIKIDRAFICDLENNHHSRAIVRAVIGLGRSLELPILAEGVETKAQHAFLVQEGCDEVQGYLTGRPLPIADYAKLVGRQAAAQQNYAAES